MNDDLKQSVQGPVADPNVRHPRVIARVYAPRPATEFKIRAYRLKKALASGDRDLIKSAASDMTHDERDVVLEEIVKSEGEDLRRGYWTGKDYSGARPLPPKAERVQPKPQGQQVVPMDGTGPLRRAEIGGIVHFLYDGEVRHGKLRRWGKRGAQVVTADGEYGVDWKDIKNGIAPESQAEYDGKMRKAQIRAWDAILPPEMSVEDREQFLASRGLAT